MMWKWLVVHSDLYISFNESSYWTEPINMGAEI